MADTIETRVSEIEDKLDSVDRRVKVIERSAARRGDILELKDDMAELREQVATKDDLAELREQVATKDDLAELREQMATKDDLAELRAETKAEFAEIRDQMATKDDLRKSGQELYSTIREDMHQMRRELTKDLIGEINSHVGSLGDVLREHLTFEIAALEKRWLLNRI